MNLSKDKAIEKIHVTADSLSSESDARFAEFKGNVKVTQGDFVIKSDSLKIFYKEVGGEKKAGTTESIDKIIATGNVKIESEETTAFSRQAEYDTNSMIMVLTGEDSRVFDKKNSVTGSKITFNRKDGLVKAEGDRNRRVNAVFFPDEKTTPGKEPEKKKEVYASAVTKSSSETVKVNNSLNKPGSPVKNPASEQYFDGLKEEKKPAIEAKADIQTQAGSPVKKPAPEKYFSELKEETKPVVQAKTGIQAQTAPVNVVFVPRGVEKAQASEPVTQKVAHGTLIKSIGISLIENKTGKSLIDFQEDIHKQLSVALKRDCPALRLFQSGDENFPADFIKLPRMASGSIDSFRMCETGRKYGLSAIITGFITEIKTGEEPRGILWYRDSYPFISISVHIDVYDTETGAKILDENFNYKKDSDELEIESAVAGKIDPVLLKGAFEYIFKNAGRKVCEIIKRQSWKGYVSSVSGDKILISSGSSKGLAPGNVFVVYENRLFESKDGQKFYIPGSKAGVIKITAVNNEDSEAILVAGDSVKTGYTVKPK